MIFVRTKTKEMIRLVGMLSEPADKFSKIVIHIHGMAGSPFENRWYQAFHEIYPQNGYAFLAVQHRGTGSVTNFFQEPDKYPNFGNALEIFEDSVEDIDTWVRFARELGYTEIILQGHSLGPSKIVNYFDKKPAADIKALILISPVDIVGSALSAPNYAEMRKEAMDLMKQGKPRQFLSKLFDDLYVSAATFVSLFAEQAGANIFCYSGRIHDWSMVRKINIPVLMIGGTKDSSMEQFGKSENSFVALKRELKKSPKVGSKIYEGATHSFSGFEKDIIRDAVEFLK